MKTLRCSGVRKEEYKNGTLCDKKLFEYDLVDGYIQIKCPRCATTNELSISVAGIAPYYTFNGERYSTNSIAFDLDVFGNVIIRTQNSGVEK